MDVPDWYEEIVARQLAMVPQTWSALQAHGVTKATELQLDFTFIAPGEVAADALVAFLRLETDYEVDADFDGRGAPETRAWSVVGSTHPTAVSQQILQDWVRWMVAAGVQYGGCRFDGFGASVPDSGSAPS